ncbi:hypothetical protein L0Y87_28930, partial [Burkholderia multivorans]|nr:hypothetical protein [Burkholderia multivorans]
GLRRPADERKRLQLPARRFNVKNGKANEMCDICIYPALRHLNPYDTSAHGAGGAIHKRCAKDERRFVCTRARRPCSRAELPHLPVGS